MRGSTDIPPNGDTNFAAAVHQQAQGGHAFMSTALDRRLDELSIRIPSDPLKLLSNRILDEASHGEIPNTCAFTSSMR
jgi:hypothetical protein